MEHKSPKSDPVTQALRTFTQDHGNPTLVTALDNLLWQVNAPAHLRGFYWVTRRLSAIVNSIHPYLKDDDVVFAAQTLEWIEWFHDHVDTFRHRYPGAASVFIEPKTAIDNPMLRYGASLHGLYSALFHSHSDESLQGDWDLLAGHLLIAHARVMRDFVLQSDYEQYDGNDEIGGIPNSPYPATLALRQISRLVELRDLSSLLRRSPDNFASQAWTQFHDVDQPQIEAILRFIAKAHGVLGWRERESNGGGGERKAESIDGFIDLGMARGAWQYDRVDHDDPWSLTDDTHIVIHPYMDDDEAVGIYQSDMLPEELDEGDRLLLVPSDCQGQTRSAMSHALAAKGRLKHIERQAQQLPWQYATLTEQEVIRFVQFLNGEIQRLHQSKTPVTKSERIKLEACFLLRFMLETGSSLERAHELDLISKRNGKSNAPLALYRHDRCVEGQVTHEWRIKTVFPAYRSSPSVDPALMREKKDYFYLPDMTGLGAEILSVLGAPSDSARRKRLFRSKLNECVVEVKRLLDEYTLHGRPTRNQIEQFLFRRLSGSTNDGVAAALITGRQEYASHTRLFYTTHNLNYLRQVYQTAMTPLVEQWIGKGNLPESMAEARDVHVGARHCLRTDAYQRALANVRDDLLSIKEIPSWTVFVDFHNLLTFYVTLFWNIATAVRAIRNPLLSIDDIDPTTGLTTVSDKDSIPPYHARLVWVPPLLRLQLVHYWEHLKIVRARMSLVFETCPAEAESGGFFLTTTGKSEPVTPSSMSVYLQRYLDAPANAHRRYLRTELLQRGMDVESVDALMGHWSAGEEPWGRFSSFNVMKHLAHLRRFLEPLLDELGFRLIRNPLISGYPLHG